MFLVLTTIHHILTKLDSLGIGELLILNFDFYIEFSVLKIYEF